MKVLIIEDEKYSFDNLCRLLRQIEPEICIEGPVANVETMKSVMLCQQDFDIIFADIKLEDGFCFEALADVELITPVVFITAYDDYALKAFQTGGISYLLKPIDIEELKQAVQRASQMKRGYFDLHDLLQTYGLNTGTSYATRLLGSSFDGTVIIQVSDINHIAFEEEKVNAYMNDGTHFTLTAKTLDAVYAQLNPVFFFRANRQYIINIDALQKIHKWFKQTESIEMKHYEKLRINLSKKKAAMLYEWIEQG